MPALAPEVEPACSEPVPDDIGRPAGTKSEARHGQPVAEPSPEHISRETAPPGWLDQVQAIPKVNGLTKEEKERILSRNATYVAPPPPGPGDTFANGVTIGVVTFFSKVLIRCMNRLHTYRLDVLTDAIENRPANTGLLTVSNHRSVADDPIMLAAMLPPRIMLRPGLMRWGLCSADICFQNKWIGAFMTNGKAMPIFRAAGISHPLVQQAANKLATGDWLHVYPEGRVVQKGMGYMRRGVGKMLASSHEQAMMTSSASDSGPNHLDLAGAQGGRRRSAPTTPPIVIPIYHEGMENIMPQDPETHRLLSIVPRAGQRIYALVGDPIDMQPIFEKYMPACSRSGGTSTDSVECVELFEALADRMALSIRLLRAELRLRVRIEEGHFLGDQFEMS